MAQIGPATACPHYFPPGYSSGDVPCRACGAVINRPDGQNVLSLHPTQVQTVLRSTSPTTASSPTRNARR